MSETTRFTKDPDAELDYYADWTDWLLDGDAIATSSWTVPTGITSVSESNDDTAAMIKLSGGLLGKDYRVTNHIVTDTGLEDDRTLTICVRAR